MTVQLAQLAGMNRFVKRSRPLAATKRCFAWFLGGELRIGLEAALEKAMTGAGHARPAVLQRRSWSDAMHIMALFWRCDRVFMASTALEFRHDDLALGVLSWRGRPGTKA